MNEDITMEKKLIRSVQSTKGIVDSKKNQDVSAPKNLSKSWRRDKPKPKNDQYKRPVCSNPKNRYKNDKATSSTSYNDFGGTVSELDAADDFLDDFDLKRNKKLNLAHLLNIQWQPRENEMYPKCRSTAREMFPNSIRSLMSTHKHKYNKEQFLQANCQFVVQNVGNYELHMADPDILVDWSLIEQIRVSFVEYVTCPICLYKPIASKITRCGHIYCWTCILHYLALTDKSWHKCPICFEAIHKNDLKSVEIMNQPFHQVGEEIKLQLMKRERGSTISVPVVEPSRSNNSLLLVSEKLLTTAYSKLLLAGDQDILDIIASEELQLQNLHKENEGCPELCFIEQALGMLKERKENLFMKMKIYDNNNVTENGAVQLCSSFGNEFAGPCCSKNLNEGINEPGVNLVHKHEISILEPENSRNRNESTSSSGDTTVTAEDLEIDVHNHSNPMKTFFFYQAMNGQQIYLHSLNARMLEKQYGSLENSPSVLIGKIVEIENGSMTEELRKRLRYLSHLPLICQFQIVEVDIAESVVTAETKLFFKDQLERRCRLRQKKLKEEKRLEKKAAIVARKQFGVPSPPRRLRLDSLHHFPQCGADEAPSISPGNMSLQSSRTSSPGSSKRSISPTAAAMNALSLNQTSFAQKLKDNKKEGAWQKRPTASVSESESTSAHSSGNLISDAIEVALMKARLEKEGNDQTSKNKKRKKKTKAVALCAIGGGVPI